MTGGSVELLFVVTLVVVIGGALAALVRACLRDRPAAPGGLDVVVTAAILVWTAGAIGLLGTLAAGDDASEAYVLAIAVGSTAAGGLASASYAAARLGWARLGLTRPDWRALLVSLLGVPLFLGVSAVWVALLSALGIEVPPQHLLTLVQDEEARLVLALALLYGTVGAPLTEEIIFRGMFLGVLRRHVSTGVAIAIQGAAFGLVHLADPAAVVPLAVLGAGLGWLRVSSNNLWPAIALHAGNNVVALALALGGYAW